MRWHIELILEVILVVILFKTPSGLRWFDITIGVDLAAQLLQFIPYRGGFHAFSALFWRIGIVLVGAAQFMALIEAAGLQTKWGSRRVSFWHTRILAFWICGVMTCAWGEVGQPSATIHQMNTVLLILQSACFVGWSVLFLTETV